MKEITITILCDNTASMKEGIRAEHGFSALVETGAGKVLFDTGQSRVFLHNAEVLGKRIDDVDCVILSHGHYDHTGGLKALAGRGARYRVLCHEAMFMPRYRKLEDGGLKYIGCPYPREYLESRGLDFEFVGRHAEVAPGVFFVSDVTRTNDFERPDTRLVVKDDRGMPVQDPFHDDASIYFRTPKGLVIILGCSHRGMINILRQILTLEPGVPILTVVGGTHLSRLNVAQTRKTIKALDDLDVHSIGVSHCTGPEAADEMKRAFGDRFFRAMAGTIITVRKEGGMTIQ